MRMDLHALMSQFQALPGARHGGGDDPVRKPRYRDAAEAVAAANPFLERYPDYLAFLTHYGGAGRYPDEEGDGLQYLTIYGFGEYDPCHCEELDADGFHSFAESEIDSPDTAPRENPFIVMNYAFDGTGTRPLGVYAPHYAPHGTTAKWRWPTFTSWLAEVVKTRGVLLPQTG